MFRVKYFCLHVLLAFIATGLAANVIDKLPGLHAGWAVLVMCPLLIAAMLEGQHYARTYRRWPSSGQCWCAALGMVLCAALAAWALVGLNGHWLGFAPATAQSPTLDPVMAGVAILATFGLTRAGYAVGVASELKMRVPD